MSSEFSTRNDGDGGSFYPTKNLDGLRPLTNAKSKMVVLSAERKDRVTIESAVTDFETGDKIPSEVTVLERKSTYYGPKILVHSQIEEVDYNYLITAPGPGSQLMLWGAETDEDNYRKGWYRLAEIKASLAETQPSYEVCSQCKSPIHSVEHERMAALGICDQDSE